MYARSRSWLVHQRRDSRPGEATRRRGPLSKALIAIVVAGSLGAAAPSAAQAADSIFFEGPIGTAGYLSPGNVKLTQIDIRSLDGHSACTDALLNGGGYSAAVCTNGLSSLGPPTAPFNGVSTWRPRVYSGWSGNNVELRGRQYYNL